MQAQRRQMILNSREKGLSGVMSNLSKAQGLQTDKQTALADELKIMNMG